MHILLVNDDGIHAPGIRTLAQTLASRGHRVSVCAPDRERSAASHSITLREPVTAQSPPMPPAVRPRTSRGWDCISSRTWSW